MKTNHEKNDEQQYDNCAEHNFAAESVAFVRRLREEAVVIVGGGGGH